MKIINQTQQTIIAENVQTASTFKSRLIGLLKHQSLPPSHALIITRCQSIHMFFMRFNIDVLFVDKDNKITGIVENIKPFEISPIFLKASYAIELPAGTIKKSLSSVGNKLILE